MHPPYFDKFLYTFCVQNVCKMYTKCLYTKSGFILETEGSTQKIQRRALFQYKTVKKGTPNLTSPYVHRLFTVALMKQIFGKNKSLRAASRSCSQFKPEKTPEKVSHISTNFVYKM